MSFNAAFNFDGVSIKPGGGWANMLNLARHNEHRGRNDISRLGIALSGAVEVLSPVEMDLDDFVEAARPPLDEVEISELRKGYMIGNVILANTIGEHMPVEEAQQ